MTIEIVDFPSYKMVDLSIVRFVNVYQRVKSTHIDLPPPEWSSSKLPAAQVAFCQPSGKRSGDPPVTRTGGKAVTR